MSYSYKQWGTETTADNVIHASDLERWQDGITEAGGTWEGSWTDEKDTLTAEQLNALEAEIASLYGTGFTAKTWEDGQVPGVDEWNRIEDAINAILNRTAFAIYCETDNSLTFYVDYPVPSAGETYNGKVATNVYTDVGGTRYSETSVPWYDLVGTIQSVVINSTFSVARPRYLRYWFSNFENAKFTGLNYIDTSQVTEAGYMFYNCTGLTSVDALADWDVSSVTITAYMFYGCTGLTSVDALAGWDVSSVMSMAYMFYGCTGLTSVDALAGWDTSSVTAMNHMFRGCSSLVSADISKWDTSKVTTMSRIFYECSNLTSLDVSGWDTSSVTDFSYMFYNCNALTGLDVSGWDTSSATTMSRMFYGCNNLTSLDVSGWDTSKVTDMAYMFRNCTGLITIYSDDSKFVTTAVTSDDVMFTNDTKLVGGNGTTYDSSKVDSSMAHIDTADNPGYFTAKG